MTSLIASLSDSEIRQACREKIEALEHWLRRMIDDALAAKYEDYFSHTDASGSRIIKSAIAQDALSRREREPQRYPRAIDAILLEDAIDIVCNPQLFKENFRVPLRQAFPDGREEARTFLKRISAPRNNLAHSNAISLRQAEQVVCYANDVIDSLKAHYRSIGMDNNYDAPLILKLTDSFGNSFVRSQFSPVHDGGILKTFLEDSELHLRPGDVLTLEVEVDPSYDPTSYNIIWSSTKAWSDQPQTECKVVIPITNRQVGQQFNVMCTVTANREWHRMGMDADDFLLLYYRVLPPVS
ncbi:hypothetical protein [Stenotrophomonas sp. TWI819]|uniref:hypothetical protein n=1 Tax=Stenotrophomonas sp. TWI819 TaxID=3136800 RepID=UPI0032093E4F